MTVRDLASAKDDLAIANSDLRVSKERVRNLEEQLQSLTSKVSVRFVSFCCFIVVTILLAQILDLQGHLEDSRGVESESVALLSSERDSLRQMLAVSQATVAER